MGKLASGCVAARLASATTRLESRASPNAAPWYSVAQSVCVIPHLDPGSERNARDVINHEPVPRSRDRPPPRASSGVLFIDRQPPPPPRRAPGGLWPSSPAVRAASRRAPEFAPDLRKPEGSQRRIHLAGGSSGEPVRRERDAGPPPRGGKPLAQR